MSRISDVYWSPPARLRRHCCRAMSIVLSRPPVPWPVTEPGTRHHKTFAFGWLAAAGGDTSLKRRAECARLYRQISRFPCPMHQTKLQGRECGIRSSLEKPTKTLMHQDRMKVAQRAAGAEHRATDFCRKLAANLKV